MFPQLPFRKNILQHASALMTASILRMWMRTLDYKTIYWDGRLDPAVSRPWQQRFIYVFWHEYILFPLYLRGHCDLCMLASPHRDGDFLERIARHLGFHVARGSSYAGRIQGTRVMLRRGGDQHLTLTPDGPRGPRRHFTPGAIFLASRLQVPIVCVGLGLDRPWRLTSWDRFAIPRPFTRARCLVGKPIHVPPAISATERERYRQEVENQLQRLTLAAESWAQSRNSHPSQIPTVREPRRHANRHVTPCPPGTTPAPHTAGGRFAGPLWPKYREA